MAGSNKKISQFTNGDPAQSGDLLAADRSGVNFSISAGSIAALAPTPTFGSANPSWWGIYDGGPYGGVSNAGNGFFGSGVANQVKCVMIRVPYTIKVSKLVTRILSTSAAKVAAVGIYSSNGNTKLIAWENFSVAVGGTLTTTLGAPVTLAPGMYIAVTSCSETGGPTATTLGGYLGMGTNEGVEPWNTNGTARAGTAANAMSSGVLPSTLGAISAGGGGFTALPNVLMEP